MSLKDVVCDYWEKGHAVVSLKGKKPLAEWSRWIDQPQTKQDLEKQPWKQADGFAIIGGRKLKNGCYVGAIDFDVKNVESEVVEKARQILKEATITQCEQTPSGGQHWIYHSRNPVKTVSIYHNSHALELLGEKRLIIMAPSQDYKHLNHNQPSEKEDVEAYFYQLLGKEKPVIKEFWFDSEEIGGEPYKKHHPFCIGELLKGVPAGLRNEAAIRLASYYLNFRRLEPKKAGEQLKQWNQYNRPPLAQKNWTQFSGRLCTTATTMAAKTQY